MSITESPFLQFHVCHVALNLLYQLLSGVVGLDGTVPSFFLSFFPSYGIP
jgi:hypothetical protein